MASIETRVGFVRTAAHRANFTRMASDPLFGVGRAAYRHAQEIERTAATLARAEFGGESEYAGDFDTEVGPIVSIEGLRRCSFRVTNKNRIASIVELGPKNPGPRRQGGRSGDAHHILARAAQAHASSGIHGQG